MLPLAAEQYQRQRRRTLAAMLLARREWDKVGEDLEAGWQQIGQRVSLIVASAQMGAATDGAAWVDHALTAQGQNAEPVAKVIARGFAGIASDGRPLESLLYSAIVNARAAQAESLTQRLLVGRSSLDALVQGQVADASRDASTVAITTRPNVSWVRVVNPPCCQRCSVLAGRVYRFSQGFQRHPHCDCAMLPQTVANPDAAGIVIGPGDVKDLTLKQRAAIDGGADFNATVNDYQRKSGDYLPPTRVDRITRAATSRPAAVEALTRAGLLAP